MKMTFDEYKKIRRLPKDEFKKAMMDKLDITCPAEFENMHKEVMQYVDRILGKCNCSLDQRACNRCWK